jgi:hypothetical protein
MRTAVFPGDLRTSRAKLSSVTALLRQRDNGPSKVPNDGSARRRRSLTASLQPLYLSSLVDQRNHRQTTHQPSCLRTSPQALAQLMHWLDRPASATSAIHAGPLGAPGRARRCGHLTAAAQPAHAIGLAGRGPEQPAPQPLRLPKCAAVRVNSSQVIWLTSLASVGPRLCGRATAYTSPP